MLNGIQMTLGVEIICDIISIIFTGAGICYAWVSSKTKGDWFFSNFISRGIIAILFGALMFVASLVVDVLIIGFYISFLK